MKQKRNCTMSRKKNNKMNIKRVGEIMDELDSPHRDFDLTEQFQKNGPGAPSGPKPTQSLLDTFQNTYETVSSEHLAQELFTMGRLREYFQAWIVPKMPDPLPAYLDELSYMGYPMHTGFDGSPCIMVRYRGCVDVHPEELEDESEETLPAVYTDDWEDDLSDLEPPFED